LLDQGYFLFLKPPRRVREGLIDILWFKIWISLQDLIAGSTRGEETNDHPDRDAQPSDTGFPAHHGGIERDAIDPLHYNQPHHGMFVQERTLRNVFLGEPPGSQQNIDFFAIFWVTK
jgi:hypothetical protein